MNSPTRLLISLCAVLLVPAFASGENHWHVSTYRAEYIEGHTHGNHALYCGDETIPACSPTDTIGGVGRGWFDDVMWRSSAADPSEPVSVRLTGLMNYDLPDADWDFLELYIQRADSLDMLATWTGSSESTVHLDFGTILDPGEYAGPGRDEVRLFWRVWTSIDGWDDEDCISPSHGACQIDDLSVYMDGTLVSFDDFEPGHPVNWEPILDEFASAGDIPGIGAFAVTAHPNPFNPRTTITFALPRAADVNLAVFDLQGRRIRGLAESTGFTAGTHHLIWNGRDDSGRSAASGTYFYRLSAGRESATGKLTLLK